MADATTTDTTTTTTTTTADAPQEWVAALSDDSLKGYVANKGLHKLPLADAFKKVAEFHQNAEGRLGIPADRVLKMPAADSPQADWDAFHTRRGRPAGDDKYELPATDANKEFAAAFSQAAFKAGMTTAEAQSLWKGVNDYHTGKATAEADVAKASLTNERAELEKSWGKGSDFQAKKLVAMRAAKAAGASEEDFEASFDSPGFSKAWNLFLFFGQKMGEDTFIPGGLAPSSVFTREQALQQLSYYRDLNHELGKKMAANNPETLANFRALAKIAYPDEGRRVA